MNSNKRRSILLIVFAVCLVPGCGIGTSPDSRRSAQVGDGPGTSETTSEKLPDGGSTAIVPATAKLPRAPGLENRKFFVPLADVISNVDPQHDKQWATESFSALANSQLKLCGKLVSHPEERTAEHLAQLVATEFQCASLRPACAEVFRDASFAILRQVPADTPSEVDQPGSARLVQALEELTAAFDETAANIRVKFKIIRVELAPETAQTAAYFEASGDSGKGVLQQNAIWHCEWTRPGENEPPKLLSIRVTEYEEIQPGNVQRPLFADCTDAVLGDTASFREQLSYGADHWYGNLDVAFGIRQDNQGLAIADVNGDGREDVYVCQPAGLPNRLYVQTPAGTLVDATYESGVAWLDLSRSALFVDLDNDNDQDLVVVLRWYMLIHENDGKGRFQVRKVVETNFSLMSLTAADYDNDGDLDLYVCGYGPGPEGSPTDIFANPVPYHDANNGARNFLLRNEGQLDFLDVTEEVGLEVNNRRFSFAAAWEDYDNDGDLDVYVANDFGRNNLYRNDDGKFVDVASAAGVEDIAAGMSVSWADYDHDGLMDVYIANMFSSAGNRIAYQRQFKADSDQTTRDQIRRHARGNTLFRNQGDGRFADVSLEAGVTMGRWAWGSLFTDLNNDGWEDLYVVNGFLTTSDTGDL